MKRTVAITGFGVVSPIATGRDAFWDALAHGQPGIDTISRFDASTFKVQLAAEVKEDITLPDDYRAMAQSDRKVAYGVTACIEALESANIHALDSRTLLHTGASLEFFDLGKIISDGSISLKAVAQQCANPDGLPLQVPLNTTNEIIEKMYGQAADSLTNCSACAASAQAIGHGFQSIRDGLYDLAVCGGFDSMINPLGVGGFQLLRALTTSNDRGGSACRSFDVSRDGTVLGEGAAMIVMEPLDKARARGANILAEIVGYGSSLDAANLSAPAPDGSGAIRSMQQALADAGIPPENISHINTHGTGTFLNDQTEAAAIRTVFAEHWQDIPVTATKSMTGHMIAAAGAIEIGACLGTLHNGTLPPNISLNEVAADCELNHVTKAGQSFNGEYILSNSFGFGGQNATLILRRHHGES